MKKQLAVSMNKIREIQEASKNDDDIKELITIIINGWPNDKKDLSPAMKIYFNYRDELSTSDNIVFKGEKILIPK